jgi:putative DNA primase/helicase
MFAWVHDAVATHSPILCITSAEPESGKTTTLGLIAFLMPRSIVSAEISEAALYRSIEMWQPSFCIDEFDSVLASEDKQALRSVINTGHTRGSGVVRCNTDQNDKTPRLFPTFSPKAIGMVGRKLPATTLSRCLLVELRRRKGSEMIDRFEHKDDAELAQLRRRLLRWSMDNEEALQKVEPPMPADLDNRRADNWRLQFRISDLAGGDWGDQARAAGLRLEGKSDKRTIGARLLADVKAVFDADGGHCMHSAVLVAELVKDPERPWVEFTGGKPLTQTRLARLLAVYGIVTQSVRPPDLKTGRGYYRAQFEDAWERYLPTASSPDDPDFPSPSLAGG